MFEKHDAAASSSAVCGCSNEQTVGTTVEVKYGKLYFPGVITKNCGFNEYDVLYDENNKKEVGVKRERIVVIWHEVSERAKRKTQHSTAKHSV